MPETTQPLTDAEKNVINRFASDVEAWHRSAKDTLDELTKLTELDLVDRFTRMDEKKRKTVIKAMEAIPGTSSNATIHHLLALVVRITFDPKQEDDDGD